MMIRFDENEYLMMAMFEKGNRRQTMREIRSVIPFLKEDAEMLALVSSILEKMERISDGDFSGINLEPYRQEPMEDE